MDYFAKSKHSNDLENVIITDNINEDTIMTIEGPNDKRTIFLSLSYLIFLILIFLFYLFLPNSKFTQLITINTGEKRKIDVNNIISGDVILRLYSLKSNINLNRNKIYFGQFKVNLSINYYYKDQKNNETSINNIFVEPIFESYEEISFPITLYSDHIPKRTDSASFVISSERVSIQKIALEFAFDNSIHYFVDLTWNSIGTIIILFSIFQYYIEVFKNNKKCRIEQKITLIYLLTLCFGNFPFSLLFQIFPSFSIFQKSLINSIFLCSFLVLFESIKMRGKPFSHIPYISLGVLLLIIDLLDTKFAFIRVDALIGLLYLCLYLFEFFGALQNYDETEKLKMILYSLICIIIPFLLFLSRIITKWCELFYLKHINVIFPYMVHITYASLLSYLFYPINPTEEVEYSRFVK